MKIKYSLILLILSLINSFDCLPSNTKLKLDNNLIRYLEIQLKRSLDSDMKKDLEDFLKNQNYPFIFANSSYIFSDYSDLFPKDLVEILNKFKYNNKGEECERGHVAPILGNKAAHLDPLLDDYPTSLTFSEDLTLLFCTSYSRYRLIGHKHKITCADFYEDEFVVSGDISGKIFFWHPIKKLIFSCTGHSNPISKIFIKANSRSFKTSDISGKSIDWTFIAKEGILVSDLGSQKVTLEYSKSKEFKKQVINLTQDTLSKLIILKHAFRYLNIDFDTEKLEVGQIEKLKYINQYNLNPQDKLILIEAILYRIAILIKDNIKFPSTDLLAWLFEYFSNSHKELYEVTYLNKNLFDEVSIMFSDVFNLLDQIIKT